MKKARGGLAKIRWLALWLMLGIMLTGVSAHADVHETATRIYVEGNGLFDQGRFAEAAAAYDRALAVDSKYVEAVYNRALANEMVDRSKALEGWQRFLDAAADRPEFKWDVARVRARMQILKDKPPLPEAMQPGRYVTTAGDYYRVIALASEGEQWGGLPVKVFLGNAPTMKWQQGTREAFDIWGAVFPLQLVARPETADIRLGWEESLDEAGRIGEESEWVRIKRVGGQLTGRRVAVITVDLSRQWSRDEMRAIILHELGHAVGIKGHSDSTKDIMYWQMQEKFHQVQVPRVPFPIFWKSLVKQPSQRDMNTLIRLYNSPGSIARFN